MYVCRYRSNLQEHCCCFVLVAHLMLPLREDYIAMTTWVTVIGDMGRTLTGVVLTRFKVLSQQLFGGTTEKHENSKMFCRFQ